MSVPYLALTDAVVDYINAQTYTPAVTAVRKYAAIAHKQKLSTLRCSVIPGPLQQAEDTFGAGRGTQLFEQEVWVVLQKKVPNEQSAEIDTYVGLLNEINDSLRRTQFDLTTTVGQWIGTNDIVPFDADAITSGVYMGAFSAIYQVEVDT